MLFKDCVALVTGGASGIGAAAARRLAIEGARVAVIDIRLDAAERIAEMIRGEGGEAIAVAADVAKAEDNATAFDKVEAAFGGIDLAFLNAGALQDYLALDALTDEVFDRMIAINLRGAYLGVAQAYRRLRPGGSCVVTASAAGLVGFPDGLAYAAAKHGVVGIVRSAARDFAARDLRINCICPGHVLTPMMGAPVNDAINSLASLANPDYRGTLSPQIVAESALFLLGQGAAGVNGHAQVVDAALLAAFAPQP